MYKLKLKCIAHIFLSGSVTDCCHMLPLVLSRLCTCRSLTLRILRWRCGAWNPCDLWALLAVIVSLVQTQSVYVLSAVSLRWCVSVMQLSSALTPLTLSTASLCLTGEASHMDRERDWEVLSQPCGDQGEGNDEWHVNINTHTPTEYCVLIHSSSPFTEPYLVFMTHTSQVDYRLPSVWDSDGRTVSK